MASDSSAYASPLFFSRYVEKIVVPARICRSGDRCGRCLPISGYDGVHHSLPEIPASRYLCAVTKNGSSELESLPGFAGYRFCRGGEEVRRKGEFGGSPFTVRILKLELELVLALDRGQFGTWIIGTLFGFRCVGIPLEPWRVTVPRPSCAGLAGSCRPSKFGPLVPLCVLCASS